MNNISEIIIEGKVNGVRYHNKQNGYTIIDFLIDGEINRNITVVANMNVPPHNMELRIIGEYVNNPKYGSQFMARSYEEIMPNDIKGIENYLGGGLFKGIGPVTAKKIVNYFGIDTFDILDNNPERLKEIKGIGKKIINSLIESWIKNKELKDVMVFLRKYNISNKMSMKIYKKYGSNTIKYVSEHPYNLIKDIDGIGFLICDKIALSMGISYNSPDRICASITYIMEEFAQNGNTYQTPNNIIDTTLKYLNNTNISDNCFISYIEVEECIEDMYNNFQLIKIINDGEIKIFLPRYYYSEKNIAKKLITLSNSKIDKNNINISIEDIENNLGIKYNDNQKKAIKTAIESNIMVLTGGPGTGKTTVTKGIIKSLEMLGMKISCAAPTGKAADRMTEVTGIQAYTIHRLIGCKPTNEDNENSEMVANNRINTDVLIIDESSMINTILMDILLSMVSDNIKLIIIGDVDQLPCIGPGNILYDIIQSNKIPVIKLTEIYRQAKSSKIITTAHNINNGIKTDLNNKQEDDLFFIPDTYDESIINNIVNLMKNRLPRKYNIKPTDIQVLTPMRIGPIGTIALNKILQEELNSSTLKVNVGDGVFKLNDKVMQIKNNYDKDIFNGDTGIITNIDLENENLKVKFKDKIINYDFDELDELMLAYAITIHKSQGSEYPICIIPIKMSHYIMLKRNLIYTAITRCKNLCIMIGEEQAFYVASNTLDNYHRKTNLNKQIDEIYYSY